MENRRLRLCQWLYQWTTEYYSSEKLETYQNLAHQLRKISNMKVRVDIF